LKNGYYSGIIVYMSEFEPKIYSETLDLAGVTFVRQIGDEQKLVAALRAANHEGVQFSFLASPGEMANSLFDDPKVSIELGPGEFQYQVKGPIGFAENFRVAAGEYLIEMRLQRNGTIHVGKPEDFEGTNIIPFRQKLA